MLKRRTNIDFGSIPAPYTKQVTVAFAEADAFDMAQPIFEGAPPAGVFITGGRCTTTGVVQLTIGTTGGTTVTVGSVDVEVFLTKGSALT